MSGTENNELPGPSSEITPLWLENESNRDPNMKVGEQKLIKIFAYLGLNVYLFLKRQKSDEEILYRHLRLRRFPPNESRIGFDEFHRTCDECMVDAVRKINRLETQMADIWNFLYELPANFERLSPDGTRFIGKLADMDESDLEDDVTPIADVSAGNAFDEWTPGRSTITARSALNI